MTKWLRTFTFSFAAMIGLAFSSTPSLAQEFVRAPNQKFYLDLDTHNGVASQWRSDDTTSLSRLRAKIRVPRIGLDRNWLPGFTICVDNREPGQKEPKHRAGVQLYAPQRRAPLSFRLIQLDDEQFKSEGTFKTLLNLDEKIDIELDWGAPNTLKITIGQETRTLKVPWVINSIVVVASTGDLVVEPLELGSTHH